MITKTLNTGVTVTFNERTNELTVNSPYEKSKPVKLTILRWLVSKLKKVI